jgi:hypothetical protein
MLFDDPLSAEFNEVAQRIKEETLALLPRKHSRVAAVKQPKQRFYMSKELRARLQELLKRQLEDNVVATICKRLLNLKMVPLDSINYLGLSNDDYSKISYITPERYERVQGQTFVEKYITNRTRVVINRIESTSVYQPDGTRIWRENPRQLIALFQKKDLENDGNKGIKLVRSKKYNEEESQKQGTNVYDITHHLDKQFNRTYHLNSPYGYSIFNDVLLNAMGDEHADWFMINLEEKTIDSVWDYTLRYHQSIHKILSKLFGNEYSEREKNIFSEQYFKLVIPKKKGIEFDVVDGDDFLKYYLETNYFRPTNGSTLWQSCMRYENTQKFLKFYLGIPGTKLAVLKEQGRVIARSILWYVNEKVYYDRIYYYNEEALAFMENYLQSVGFTTMRQDHGSGVQAHQHIRIPLSYSDFMDFDYYPYADSLRYYYPDKEILTNEYISGETVHKLERTDGSYDSWPEEADSEEYYCEECDFSSHDPDDITSVERGPGRGRCVCGECGVWSEEYNETILRDSASYCDYSQSYVLDEDTVRLANGDYCYNEHIHLQEYENGFGYFVTSEDDYVELDGKYYHPEDPALVQEQEQEEEEQEENNII